MKFWPFPLIRVYRENKRVTKIFLMFASSKNLRILREGVHEITLTCEHGDLLFWNANKYYAWGKIGCFSTPEGSGLKWVDELPSRYAARALRLAIQGKFAEAI